MITAEAQNAHWYVIEARDGGGERAHLALALAGITVWRPIDVRRASNRSRYGRPRADIRVPRFGRYFFIHCRMTDGIFQAVLNLPGVMDILREAGGDMPAAIPDAMVAWLRQERAPSPSAQFAIGDRVRVTEGPYTGLQGKISRLDRGGVARVDLLLFGRTVPVPFEAGCLEITLLAKSRAISGLKRRAPHRSAGAAAYAV